MEKVGVIITDTHLSEKNQDQIIEIFRQSASKVKRLGLNVLYHAGDFFDSRKFQRLSTLKAAIEIFQIVENEGIELRIIPGNHDKADYKSEESYLDVFSRYDCVKLITTSGYYDHGDVRVHMIPFFCEKTTYSKYLGEAIENIDKSKKNVLLTHIAIDGVKNNDGSTMEGTVVAEKLTDIFDLILVGHYHNYQEMKNGKIIYIGSTHQHNYGEDLRKGLTILYDDLSIEQESLRTKVFNVIEIDLNDVPSDQVDDLVEKYKVCDDNVRFKFTGPKEKVDSIDKNRFKKLGIDVKTKVDDVQVDLSYVDSVNFKAFTNSSIISEWSEFAVNKEVNEDDSKYMESILKKVLIK